MARRKYFFNRDLPNIPRHKLMGYLKKEVFDLTEFNADIEKVSSNLQIDKAIVKDVVVSYFYNIALVINTIRKIKTKINVYGFFSLIVEKGRRV